MDLSIGLLGVLAIVGYNFTARRNPEAPKRCKLSAHDVPNGETVY
jgi:hypothetical protein